MTAIKDDTRINSMRVNPFFLATIVLLVDKANSFTDEAPMSKLSIRSKLALPIGPIDPSKRGQSDLEPHCNRNNRYQKQ